MSEFKLEGLPQQMKKLENKLGKEAMLKRTDRALIKGGDLVFKKLKQAFEKFKDTGASIDEMKRSEPRYEAGERTVTIYWEGPKNRQNIIHLNEHGFERDGTQYTPEGFGVMDKTLNDVKSEYFEVMRKEMTRDL